MTRHSVTLLLGSNTRDAVPKLKLAMTDLAGFMDVSRQGGIVFSEDVTGRGEPYANMTIEGTTEYGMTEFCELLSCTERSLGRTAASKYQGVMPMDIDVVVWDGEVVSAEDYKRPYFGV